MDHWCPKHVEPPNVKNKLNHKTLCILYYIYILQWVCVCVSTGFVNKVLSCKFFYPLSRISYCAYLVHPIIMISVIMHMDSPVHLGRATMVRTGGSDTTVSAKLNYKIQGIHDVCSYLTMYSVLTTSDRIIQTYTNRSLSLTVCVWFCYRT